MLMKTKKRKETLNSKFMLFLICFFVSTIKIYCQDITIKGNVKDEDGESIIGAVVNVKGDASKGTSTDMDGNFLLSVPQSAQQLTVKYLGMETQEVKIIPGQFISVILKKDSEQLDEVVVIGYQTIKRRDLTGSVASVTGKAIADAPVANVAQALQGKLPGVNVISQDGRPDASVSIRVRGGGSISQSNDPLILVDGVTVSSLNDIPSDQIESVDVLKDASSTAIYGARGANGVILVTTKGAKEGKVAVSYSGYAKFNTPTKYLKALNPYDYLAYKWAVTDAYDPTGAYRVPFEKLYGLGAHSGNNVGGIDSYRNTPMYDVQKDVYNSSFSHNHDLSITGGSENTKVLFSVNYMDEQGMKINSYRKRANVSLKVNQKILKNLNIDLDTRYTDTKNGGDEGATSGSGSTLSSAYRFRPIATENILGDLTALNDGGYIDSYGKFSQMDNRSPMNILKDRDNLRLGQNLRATISLNWNILPGLTYHTDFNLNRNWNQDKKWTGAIPANDNERSYLNETTGGVNYSGDIDYRKADSWGLRWTNTMNYDVTVADNHKINLLAGHEVTNSGGSFMRMSATMFPSNFTKDNAFAMISQYDKTNGVLNLYSGINTPTRILSFFGRANYTLKDRYLVTLTFRADGSSKFSPEHRWGYFPAGAFAWRITEESFMKEIHWLDNLKLRVSYGEVGNDGIDSNKWMQTWTDEGDNRWQYTMDNKYLPSYDLSSDQMANKSLKWETTITRNIGLDFTVLKNRLWGTIDIYKNTTKDLLMLTSLPGITSFTSTYANVGQTSNKGLELSLSGVVFKNKDWNITAGANINFNKGNVDKLAEGITGLYGTQWIQQNKPADDYILKEGSPVGLVRGLVYEGFYTTNDFNYANGVYTLKDGIADISSEIVPSFFGPKAGERPTGQIAYPGMAKYKDSDKSGKIDSKDYEIIGDMNPKHTGGFNINVNYKNFDLGMYFNWSYGNDVYNVNKLASLYGYSRGGVYQNKLNILNNSYKIYDIRDGQLVRISTPAELDALNKNASLPLAYNETGVVSSLGIEDGSYLRLNTLTIGYSLPKLLIKKIGINSLRVYGTIYNLATITGYSGLDPEVSANSNLNQAVYPTPGLDWGTYPRARSFVLGLNLNF